MGNRNNQIFITGIAGFIGFHLALSLKDRGYDVYGCDSFNDYYSPLLKRARAKQLLENNITIFEGDLTEAGFLENCMDMSQLGGFVHLAAQAGVRYSITHPEKYQQSNLLGFFQVLELLRKHPHVPLTFASSSSVYGLNKKIPFSEEDPTDHPANFYGSTKKANEVMAFSYHHLYGISMRALRFFTVYGPYGRPDMAYYFFTKAIEEGETIKVFNEGNMQRDFTYIDDIVDGIIASIELDCSFEIFNLGNNQPEPLLKMIQSLETLVGKKANLKYLPMQPGEIQTTFADITKAKKLLNFSPKVSLEQGLERFYNWYRSADCSKIESLI